MTETEIIKQLIMSNWVNDYDYEGEPCFSFCWKWTKLIYHVNEANKGKSVHDMLDWFYQKVIQLSESNIVDGQH